MQKTLSCLAALVAVAAFASSASAQTTVQAPSDPLAQVAQPAQPAASDPAPADQTAADQKPADPNATDPKTADPAPVQTLPGYEGLTDHGFKIPAVLPQYLAGGQAHKEVPYYGPEKPNTIVVDIYARRLYYILPNHRAMRFAVAVGRAGLAFKGTGVIERKVEWPHWQPTQNMLKTRPDLYAPYAKGLPGGTINPLGARAMYLYKNGHDTLFRIHGTIENSSIGHATSAGCIRLFDQDAIRLFKMVKMGTVVHVRTLAESLAMEGPYMNDAWGRAVPDTPQNRAQKVRDMKIVEAQKAALAARIAADPSLAGSVSENFDPPPGYTPSTN